MQWLTYIVSILALDNCDANHCTYRISGNFRGVKNWKTVIFDFREYKFHLTSLLALHCLCYGKPRLGFRG